MSIKQAIEALEELVEYAEEAGFDWSLDNARAALAALMPAEPVEVPPYIYGREAGENEKVWTEREVQMLVRERDMLAARVLDLMSATPHTEAVRMSDAVGWRYWTKDQGFCFSLYEVEARNKNFDEEFYAVEKVYVHPTTPTATPRLTDAEIQEMWDEHKRTAWNKPLISPVVFARAVEQATAARLGVKMGDV